MYIFVPGSYKKNATTTTTWSDSPSIPIHFCFARLSKTSQDALLNVQHVTGNHRAFAAILSDEGKVVTWGDGESGGKSAAVQDQLRTGDAAYEGRRCLVSIRLGGKK